MNSENFEKDEKTLIIGKKNISFDVIKEREVLLKNLEEKWKRERISKEEIKNKKFGFTKNSAEKRIKCLQTGNSGDLDIIYEFKTNHKRKLETALHNRFKHMHYNREFYMLDVTEVSNFIETCNTIEKGLDSLKALKNKFY